MQQRFRIQPMHTDASAFSAYRASREFPGNTRFTAHAEINSTTNTWGAADPQKPQPHGIYTK